MNKVLKTAAWPIMALPLAYLAIVWNSLPDTIAMRFDLEGKANDFGDKIELLVWTLILTAVNAGIFLLLTNIHRIDPKKHVIDNKPRMERIAVAVVVFMSALFCMIIYGAAHNIMNLNTKLVFAGVGLLFCFMGNYIHNIKPNYFAGIRLPWTLENEENWRKTHLLAGKLFFVGGLLITVVCLLMPANLSMIAFISIVVILVVIPCVYSYRLYRQQKSLHR